MEYSGFSVAGFGRGKEIGFPTINLQIQEEVLQDIEPGIYAAHVKIQEKKYLGALFYGIAETFSREHMSLEIYLIDAPDIEIPEHTVVSFDIGPFIRGVEKFETVEKLVERMKNDVEKIRQKITIF